MTPSDPNARNADFAALRCLNLVHQLGSFSAAAAQLGVNQSVVSYTIDKLRRVFDDPLFHRQGGGIVPTERCDMIVQDATELVRRYDALLTPAAFDPARARDTVTLACNYYERQIVLPPVVRRLRQEAPGLRLRLVNSTAQGDKQLRRAEADLLIGPLRPDAKGFYSRVLLHETYVGVLCPDNSLATHALSLADYTQAPHVTITYGGGWRSAFLRALDEAGQTLNEVLTVPSPAGLDRVIAGTDLMATVPQRIAQSLTPPLRQVDAPFPAPFDIALVWTERTHRSGLHRWLRSLVSSCARDIGRQERRGARPEQMP